MESQSDYGIRDIRDIRKCVGLLAQNPLLVIFARFVFLTGAGTLGIPFAVLQGGYLSLATVALIGLLNSYTGKLIIGCLYETPFLEKRTSGSRLRNSYALIGKNAN